MSEKSDLLFFSDFHAHNFNYGAKRVQYPFEIPDDPVGFFNSRLVHSVRVLREIRDYALDLNIKTLVFGGDLFHRRTVLHVDAYNAILQEFRKIEDAGITTYMIPGNHDYADRHGHVHSLEGFRSKNTFVLDEVCSAELENNIHLITVQYTDNPQQAKEYLRKAEGLSTKIKHDNSQNKCILLAHLGMQGATVGSDYVLVSQSDIEVTDIDYKKFDLCLFGHYHQHQKIFQNGWYIGATFQHNWGDANTVRGFLHVNSDTLEFKHIETQSAPRFVKIRKDEEFSPSSPRQWDFVRYIVPAGSAVSVEDAKTELGIDSVEVVPLPSKEEKVNLPDNCLDPASLIESWVEGKGLPKEYCTLGKELLAKAEGLDL